MHILWLLTATLPALVSAQKDRQAYCDFRKKVPNLDNCFGIKNSIKDGETYAGRDEWWNGNCRVKLNNGQMNSRTIKGSDVKQAIQNIIDTCDVGFEYVNNVRVDVEVCTVSGGGITAECKSPLQHLKNQIFKRDDAPGHGTGRRHLIDTPKTTANPNHVFRREDVVWDGLLVCGGGASAIIKSCQGLADDMHKKHPGTVPLPYLAAAGGDCELQIWPISKEFRQSFDSVNIQNLMALKLDTCADSGKKIIGFMQDYSMAYEADGQWKGFHMFVGTFCGRLGAGVVGSCTPGG